MNISALVAQWIEQRTSNPQVEGSNPSERTIFIYGISKYIIFLELVYAEYI